MILEAYILLLSIALIILTIGYVADSLFSTDYSWMIITAYSLLFIISIIMLIGNIEYKIGETTNTTYSYDDSNTTINTMSKTTYDYNNFYDDNTHWFGLLLTIVSVVGLLFSVFEIRSWNKI